MLSAAGEDEHPTDDKRGNICFFELTPGGNRVESFETYQPYLFSIAYRMLGSAMDAEDMVQDTYIRYQAVPPQTIHSLKAYLTTILTRLCINQLQLARRNRELYTVTDLRSENVIVWADGGGKIKQAALRPIRGRDAVARFSLGTKRFWPENARVELKEVNGQAALIIRAGGQVFSVLTIDVEQGRIQAIRIIANPEKLARV